jgi:hypothetical protein
LKKNDTAFHYKTSVEYCLNIPKKKWALVGLWWAHPRDISETSTVKLSFQLKKKSFLFIRCLKAGTKLTLEFSGCWLIGLNGWLDFFGRLPIDGCWLLVDGCWVIF